MRFETITLVTRLIQIRDILTIFVHRAITTSTQAWQTTRRESDKTTTEELIPKKKKEDTSHDSSKKKTPFLPTHLREISTKTTNMRTRASGCLQGKTSIFHPTYRNSHHCPHHPCTLFRLPYQNHRLRSTHHSRSREPLRNSA